MRAGGDVFVFWGCSGDGAGGVDMDGGGGMGEIPFIGALLRSIKSETRQKQIELKLATSY